MEPLLLVFVHGYSVSHLNTYGQLPLRLKNEAVKRGILLQIENIYLGRYISFNDEVQMTDLAKALQSAISRQIPQGKKFVCISHSTGGPLVRSWLHLFHKNSLFCPLSHLIMLAPANHGSALAQLGKSRIGRLKSWFNGIEPGQRVLNWLELGSEEAWQLNKEWILKDAQDFIKKKIFLFVLSGQDIDRKLYDHLNSYTGEAGSDGVVRLASSNLNTLYLKLVQQQTEEPSHPASSELKLETFEQAPATALRILYKRSHSGDNMGILKSVGPNESDTNNAVTIQSIFECISITDESQYSQLCTTYESQNRETQKRSIIETETTLFGNNTFIHDSHCMVIFKLSDQEGNAITQFDLVLTAGEQNDPNALPKGFFADRQVNKINPSYLSYYLNYNLLTGTDALYIDGELLRKASPGIDKIGIRINPRPNDGFVRYQSCEIKASAALLQKMFKANTCTLLEIVVLRLISSELLQLEKQEGDKLSQIDFKDTEPGESYIV